MTTHVVDVLEHGVALGEQTWKAFLAELDWPVESVGRLVCLQAGALHDVVAYDYLGNSGSLAPPLAEGLAEQCEFLAPGHHVGFLGIGSGFGCMMLELER